LRKSLVFVVVLISLILYAQLVFIGLSAGKWYYWIEPGAYAKYVYVQEQVLHEEFYFANGSLRGFTNFTLVWTVTDVQGLYATVDYNLTFYGVKLYTSDYGWFGPYDDLGNMSFTTTLMMRLDTLELVENGTTWGRWPYWIHGWEVDKNVTMIYNYPVSPCWMGQLGGEPQNVTVNLGKSSIGLGTPVYNFTKERLFHAFPEVTLHIINNKTYGTWTTRFDALYDSVSLIFVSMWPKNGEMGDGIMYHKLGVWDIVYKGDVILVDTNVNFNPSTTPEDETPAVSAWLVAGVATAIVLPIVGVALQLKVKRKGKKA